MKSLTKNNRGAMEMSVGTIVTIVLLMSVLILGIFLVQRIFGSSTNAIDQVDSQIQNEINKLFADEGKHLIVYPNSGDIGLNKGSDPAGFAFSVKNNDGVNTQNYNYDVSAYGLPAANCGRLTNEQADTFVIGATGEFSVGGGNTLQNPRLVRFVVPETAPSCSFFYRLSITGDQSQEEDAPIFVTIN